MVAESDLESWANTEFSEAHLGDARLTKRLILLAEQLSKMPHGSFPHTLTKAQLKSAYRFFDNKQVDTDGVLGSHIAQTQNRMNQVPVVLAVQDTTEFNLTHLPATEGLGYCSSKHVRGFMMHSMLAVTPEGLPLGVLGMKAWARDLSELGKKKQRAKRSIDEKESVKWLEGVKQLTALKAGCPKTHMISVCDREADIYDLFVAPRPDGVDWLIRASWNRKVDHPDQYLWEAMASASELGCIELNVPARSNCAQRIAQLAIKCAPVTLRRPCNHPNPNLPNVEVFAIWALESHPPEGTHPIEWMLLSSVPTHTQEQALERLTWYARRWTIETWHRILKSGCQIEHRQLGSLDRFVRSTALFTVIAWRILYATLLGRSNPEISCEVLLQPIEWQALYCRAHNTKHPPSDPPTLNQAILWIAKLGGYLARKHDLPPGPTVLWRGFMALHEATKMFQIMHQCD
ncbi:Transposase for transposon Tn5 [Mycoavidus cysteinexigens]|uniref:Transposase for transposon Tn5 n=2 Tax=Mycoavidus cysteinexigens TaxID=1553431 RepID=A0A2Z6EVC9_9BURK|nr:IS4 family transposase [Mycoavidus cysteinexigens]BBE09381.1 Transposase for transposon Tn5 [Mycoavidus cysteinexigens]BBE09634.1 Transposase for transposon Tn5 [Mycoavidus cysteinexigens]